jgi:non-ribosomal peptide synthetase component F
MIAGHSRHQDDWIEEAVATWSAKDPAKVQDWYHQNSQKLPAAKSQYFAAAFANQATEQGDTATARQWAGHIQDAKTKQRIEAGIAKAEAAKSK